MRIANQVPLIVIWLAWLMFVLSFFLPASDVLSAPGAPHNTPLSGWQAFTMSLSVLNDYQYLAWRMPITLLFLTFPLINAAMLLSPLVLRSTERALPWAILLIACGALPWVFPEDITGELFIGFYLWNSSFFLMSAGCLATVLDRLQAGNKRQR